jgi:hypothetical protein
MARTRSAAGKGSADAEGKIVAMARRSAPRIGGPPSTDRWRSEKKWMGIAAIILHEKVPVQPRLHGEPYP